jgi:hypothetical protein
VTGNIAVHGKMLQSWMLPISIHKLQQQGGPVAQQIFGVGSPAFAAAGDKMTE